MTMETQTGHAHPLGASVDDGGVNFALFSRHATAVELLLFKNHDDKEPYAVIDLDPWQNRSFYTWHCYVKGLKAGTHYAYRVDGPRQANQGHRFDRDKVLIDPYAFGNTNHLWDRVAACKPGDNLGTSMRSVVVDLNDFDWEGDQPINRPMQESIIYEMHVGGFTRGAGAGVEHPGTFSAVIEKIPYLKALGVTAVELLPVCEFDETEQLRTNAGGERLTNYWGYSTLGFFAPAGGYCVNAHLGDHICEFRDMVKALHKAGIEVILDVVFNHTNEGNHMGPTISFKGIDNYTYYHLVRDQKQYYMDYSGCGNTVNCNHPLVNKFIVDCLEFWVRELHVDGFRFDEGSILARGEDGAPMAHPPVIWNIELSEQLVHTKVIAEAWDAGGLYQIGTFPGYRWAEWNGRYRDDIRRFVAGRGGMVGAVASRIAGSSDIYQPNGRQAINSINFVTCHDGFTLNDLVSYNGKHNEANGEDNRDGINENDSWNCGAEGPSDDSGIENLRRRQIKNFAAILLLSDGVPMILGGDEMRRSQNGNNNAYCQNNPISWYDWRDLEKHSGIQRFFQLMIAFRKRHHILQRKNFFGGEPNDRGLPGIGWHGCALNQPGWHDPGCRVLAYTMGAQCDHEDLHVILNMDDQDLDFELPRVAGRAWYRSVDTALEEPADILVHGEETVVDERSYRAGARSVAILISK